jgi:peroxiredoxin
MNGTALAILAATVLLGFGLRWLQRMQRVQIPSDVRLYLAGSATAALLGIAAFVAGVGMVGGIAAALAIVAGLAFLALYAASGQAQLTPAVAVGRPVVDFTAHDDDGNPFDLRRLRGTPFLLKFFRGHWCPYCVAELRRWEEMRAELDARGIAIVTVCSDSAEQIRQGRRKHGLRATMLPDPQLAITDRYNLRNPKNFAPKPGLIIPLPIPTTILVDADGLVRWIDQASDYMHRSDPERVLRAIRTTLGEQTVAARADVPKAAAG